MDRNEFNDIKNNYNDYINEREKARFYPATKLLEKIILSSDFILIVSLSSSIVLLPLLEIYISTVPIIYCFCITFVVGAQIIYIKNTFIYPRLLYKNYDHKFDLLEEYIVITETKDLNFKIATKRDNNVDVFRQKLTRRLHSKGFSLVKDRDEVIIAYKICKTQDRRLWWTYTLYKKLKFNIIFINGDVSNEKLQELNCLSAECENFIVRIHTESLFSDTQKDVFLFSSERNKIVGSFHLKELEIGFEQSTGKFYYRNPYIRVEYNSFLIKNRIRVKQTNNSSEESIYDEESTDILKRYMMMILKM